MNDRPHERRVWPGLVQAQVLKAVQVVVAEALGLNLFARPRATVDDDGHRDDVGPRLTKRLNGRENRTTGGRGVLNSDDLAPRDVGPFDAALHTVRLTFLTHDERVEILATRGRGVQNRERHGVRAEGEPTDRVNFSGAEACLLEGVEQDVPDQRRGTVVQRDAAQVDVVVGLLTGGERDLPMHDGEFRDEIAELLARGGSQDGIG